MDTQRISVFELSEYWATVDAFAKGGDSFDILAPAQMPLWTDICAGLSWRSHLVTGGYFGKKRHGYCGVYRLIGLATQGDLTRPATLDRIAAKTQQGHCILARRVGLNERLNQLRRGEHNASRLPGVLRQKFPSTTKTNATTALTT